MSALTSLYYSFPLPHDFYIVQLPGTPTSLLPCIAVTFLFQHRSYCPILKGVNLGSIVHSRAFSMDYLETLDSTYG